MGAFQNGLRAEQFNKSLVQKPAINMDEITSRAECYIKGEESNQEKRIRDGTEKTRGKEEAPSRRKEHSRTTARERHAPRPYRSSAYSDEYLTPLNKRREDILKEMAHMNLIREPFRHKGINIVMGKKMKAWCTYHRARGHYTEDCIQLKREIESLIQRGYLLTYVKDDRS